MTEISGLLIDDEPEVLSLLEDVFRTKGVIVDTAATTQQGLDLLAQKSYDIVVTDLNQNPSGVQVYRAAISRGIQDTYILTGGTTDDTLMREAQELAGPNLLTKPIQIDTFYRIIEQVKQRKIDNPKL